MPQNSNIGISKELKDKILPEYLAGARIPDLTNKYGLKKNQIGNWFRKAAIEIIPSKRESKIWPSIYELHQEGLTIKDICTKLNLNESSVRTIYWNKGVSVNSAPKKERWRLLNHNYFEKIDNHKKAYFFGLLCADGSLSLKEKRIGICLKKEDSYLIEQFKKEIESDAPLVEYIPKINGQTGVRLQLYSDKMMTDLIRLGCCLNKTKYLKFPKLPEVYFWSFIRGFFDGDGCITFSKRKVVADAPRVTFTSTNEFNKKLGAILLKKYGIKSCIYTSKEYSELIIYRRSDIFIFCEKLYSNNEIFMSRKRDRFIKNKIAA